MAKLHRLLFIAERCPSLQLEALRMAMTFVMTTYNTSSYQAIHRKLTDAITRLVQFDKKVAQSPRFPGNGTEGVKNLSKVLQTRGGVVRV